MKAKFLQKVDSSSASNFCNSLGESTKFFILKIMNFNHKYMVAGYFSVTLYVYFSVTLYVSEQIQQLL